MRTWAAEGAGKILDDGDDPVIWKAVNDVAAMVREFDRHHPVMTVTAEVGGGRIASLHQRSPVIDIHGINSYGGASSVAGHRLSRQHPL